ncbi:putative FAD-linked oxidoreductase [Baekduia alba]|uniref:FAD-binding oxidoreductase n=1 Tax=Baekduia alba TaxID=2997333 RepID=UPI00233FD2E4|nr:FAD-binding oxidoreductase [Baekduia alba]WCB96438.1 putative FAD-linked oxidoreductase [Baekduia alba]
MSHLLGDFDPAARWAAPDADPLIGDDLRALLAQAFAIGEAELGAGSPAAVALEVGPSALDPAARAALVAAVGGAAEQVDEQEAARAAHANGMSYLDLIRRSAAPPAAPDAVVAPADHDEVGAVLRACAAHGVAVVPFGGGTSVVGGVAPRRGAFDAVIALDLRRLGSLVSVDDVSWTATLQAGVTGPRAEALLAEHGFTLGHVPQSFERATIGGYAATRSSGQLSTGWGRFDALVEHVRVATPSGDLDLGRAPGSAAGPDLKQLILGSEGAFGVVTEVTVRVRPIPEVRRHEGWRVADLAAGVAVLRTLAQRGPKPDLARLSDEAETALGVATGGGPADEAGGCLLLVGWEGYADDVARRAEAATVILRAAGADPLGAEAAASWEHGRFRAPRLRDELLGAGLLIETLETATSWRDLVALHDHVGDVLRAALDGATPVVACHVSHLYAAGASLYFTVLARRDGDDPVGQWSRAKAAVMDALAAAGATLTHHHAVGADHAPWLAAEDGELGVEILRAVKARLDPAGVLNPGKLLPPTT